jgi:hypothetical protein
MNALSNVQGERRVAIGTTREDPPRVFVATDESALDHVLAIELVSSKDPSVFDPSARKAVRDALMHERWAVAVARGIDATGTSVDVCPDETLHDFKILDAERTLMEIRVSLFADSNGLGR